MHVPAQDRVSSKMAAKSTSQQQSLAEGVDKELTCTICLCRYDHPKVLPCLHSYCKDCLEKLAKQTSKKTHPQRWITCPQCKEIHEIPCQGVDAFRTYFTMNNLIELLRVHEATANKQKVASTTILCESGVDDSPAVAHCLTCSDHLCESCFELHKKLKITREHNVVLLKDIQQLDRKTGIKSVRQKQLCEEHKDEPLKLFCKTCQKVICRDCALVKHREHKYMFVNEIRPEAQNQLEELVKRVEKKQTEFKAHSEHLAKVRESSSAAFTTSKQELNTIFDKIMKAVEARRKNLFAQLDVLSLVEEKKMNAETNYLELALARFSNSIQFTKKLFDNEDDVEVMLMSTQAKTALESLQQLSWDPKRVHFQPLRVIFDQKDLKKCESMGSFCQLLKDDDVIISKLPKEHVAKGSFSFDISMSQEVSKQGIDFTPVLSVQVTDLSQVGKPKQVQKDVPVKIQKNGLNKWKILCTPNGIGQHEVTVKMDTVVKKFCTQIGPKSPAVGMQVVRGPDWTLETYSNEDGGEGNVGRIVEVLPNDTVNVIWDSGGVIYDYRWGQDNKYDLKLF